ncbi:MAG: zinc ribbon domain-containing protein [Deltaproteobacteria bacterium]|nr:zinc ribbon domain-containing protein [Deltaproteobacteria bacterium]
MPIYEYSCSKCGEVFEASQKMSEKPLTKCVKCGKGPVEKLISRSAFHLKGGGWYKSGYTKESSKPAACPASAPKDKNGCGGCPSAS